MKYVKLPAPIKLEPNGVSVYPFLDCVRHLVDSEEAFAKPVSRIRSAVRILDAIESAMERSKEYVAFTDEDHAVLVSVFDAPTNGYGMFNRQITDMQGKLVKEEPFRVAPRLFLPFVDAVSSATSQEPPPPTALMEEPVEIAMEPHVGT